MSTETASSTPAAAPQRTLKGIETGVVVGDKRDKSRTVVVEYQVRNRKYGKYLLRRTKYHVHDEQNVSHAGDRVLIVPCRPISKTKSWRLLKVVQKLGEVMHQA
ncbi:MAG: 30S ribosomal protein S17 [Phycisphaeraceae bacterium]|nr:30S ribosomal protein S17 [Phycisphaeraceae bacterium]